MSRIFTTLTLSLALVAGLFSLSPISAHAGGFGENMVVQVNSTARSGLNVRDQNCKVVGKLKFEEVVTIVRDGQNTCTVNGVVHFMKSIDQGSYISSNFISYIGNVFTENSGTIQSPVNFRTANCTRISTLTTGTSVAFEPTRVGNKITPSKTCVIAGSTYAMIRVTANSKDGYVASRFIRAN